MSDLYRTGRLVRAAACVATIFAILVLGDSPRRGFAQLIPLGPDAVVNTTTTGAQSTGIGRSVARAPDGSFVVVWTASDADATGVFARRFDESSVEICAEFQVNAYTTGTQFQAQVSSAGDGGFVASWTDLDGRDGDGAGTFARRFDASCAPLGPSFQVNTYTAGTSFSYSSVSSATDGRFVIVWSNDVDQDGDGDGIFGQRYASDGSPAGTEFRANTYTIGAQLLPVVAMTPSGAFVVVWRSADQDGSATGVFAQRYTAAGDPSGTEFQVNAHTPGYQGYTIDVAADAGEGFVIVWGNYPGQGGGNDVNARRLDGAGILGSEFRVNSSAADAPFPSVDVDDDGSFAVAWNGPLDGDGDGAGIFGQAFDPATAPIGTEFQINAYTTESQQIVSVATDGTGRFVVAWSSSPYLGSIGQDGSGPGVISRHFGAAASVELDWIPVDDPGNADDDTGFGSVSDTYEISKYEITNGQYAAFLNAVAAADPNGLYNAQLDLDVNGGISQSGSSGSFGYAVKTGFDNKPVNYVSFYDSLRFANWMHNGQPSGAQDASTTEDGAYTFTGPTTVGARNPAALVFLPSENEWYKAAYYDPTLPGYYDYPAATDTPTTCSLPTALANNANCDAVVNAATDAGAYPGSASPYGTFDQGGNVWERNEAVVGANRGLRGGGITNPATSMAAFSPLAGGFDPLAEVSNVGFRVARIDDDPPLPPQTKEQQACINALNKGLTRVAKAQAVDMCRCMKEFAKGKLTSTVNDCVVADDLGKVAKAKLKTLADELNRCPTAPDLGPTSAATVNAAAMQKELDLFSDVFGPDLDAVALTLAADPAGAKCQLAAAKAVKKCQVTKLNEFARCKRAGLKAGSILTREDLEDCIGHDPKGKIAKLCHPTEGRIGSTVSKKCRPPIDLASAFPGCATAVPATLAFCLDRSVECRVCLAINTADDLERDCDDFDDGTVNGSCP